jgi:hypothetical protein
VWESLKPHFDEVQLTMGHVSIATGTSSESLIDSDGNSEYYRNKKRRDILAAELHATMEILWGGSSKEMKDARMRVFEHIFGFRSKEAADNASLEKIERGVRILQSFEKRCKNDASILAGSINNILSHLDIEIQEYEQGISEVQDLPI